MLLLINLKLYNRNNLFLVDFVVPRKWPMGNARDVTEVRRRRKLFVGPPRCISLQCRPSRLSDSKFQCRRDDLHGDLLRRNIRSRFSQLTCNRLNQLFRATLKNKSEKRPKKLFFVQISFLIKNCQSQNFGNKTIKM